MPTSTGLQPHESPPSDDDEDVPRSHGLKAQLREIAEPVVADIDPEDQRASPLARRVSKPFSAIPVSSLTRLQMDIIDHRLDPG